MSRNRILAIAPDEERLQRLRAVLERAGGQVDGRPGASALGADPLPHRIVFHAWDGATDSQERLLSRVRPDAHVAALVSQATLAAVTHLLADPRCNHVFVGDQCEHEVVVTARKLLSGDIFGIEKYLPEGTPIGYFRVRDFPGRTQALDAILEHATGAGIRRQVRGAIGQVCEELLMNALYDAPVDEAGHSVFAQVDPRARVGHRSPRPVSIRFAVTADQFVVAVRDRFGGLAKETIVGYIRKCLTSDQQIDRKTYGAGLGLYLVASAAAGYVVNVAPDLATEVVCMFDRRAKTPLRTVGVFVHPGRADAARRTATRAAASEGG